jgi:hypothetical protein
MAKRWAEEMQPRLSAKHGVFKQVELLAAEPSSQSEFCGEWDGMKITTVASKLVRGG